jgi:RNA polymerase sigma-70 factor (ECF subfamily)
MVGAMELAAVDEEHEIAGRRLQPDALADHLDRLYRAARSMCRSPEDAEDLVQETCARVLARPRFVRHDDDAGYLLRVLRNTFISSVRTRARRPVLVALPEGLDAPDRDVLQPDALVHAREMLATVNLLPAPFRDVVVAVDLVGLGYEQAARALSLAPGTVRSRLHRARRALAQLLDEGAQELGTARIGAAS